MSYDPGRSRPASTPQLTSGFSRRWHRPKPHPPPPTDLLSDPAPIPVTQPSPSAPPPSRHRRLPPTGKSPSPKRHSASKVTTRYRSSCPLPTPLDVEFHSLTMSKSVSVVSVSHVIHTLFNMYLIDDCIADDDSSRHGFRRQGGHPDGEAERSYVLSYGRHSSISDPYLASLTSSPIATHATAQLGPPASASTCARWISTTRRFSGLCRYQRSSGGGYGTALCSQKQAQQG